MFRRQDCYGLVTPSVVALDAFLIRRGIDGKKKHKRKKCRIPNKDIYFTLIPHRMKNRLKAVRFFVKKTQIKLWLETGTHYSTISRIECGYINPTYEQKKKLSAALNVNPDWLFPKENNE